MVHDPGDLAASISSGSFLTMGMVVVPCSMHTLAAIAHGLSDNLLARRRRRHVEGAPAARARAARDLAQPHPPAQHGRRDGSRGHDPAAGAGFLPATHVHRRSAQARDGQGARPVRHRARLFRRWTTPSDDRARVTTTSPSTVSPSQDLHDCLASYRQQHPEDVLVVDERVSGRPGRHCAGVGTGGARSAAGRVVQRRRRSEHAARDEPVRVAACGIARFARRGSGRAARGVPALRPAGPADAAKVETGPVLDEVALGDDVSRRCR